MPTLPVPLFEDVYKGIDGSELRDKCASSYDCFRDDAGGLRSRPGSLAFCTIDSARGMGIDGLYYWKEQGVVVAVGGGSVYQIGADGVSTDKTNSTMQTGVPVSFATDGTNLVLANGGRLASLTTSTNLTTIADVDAPTFATHVGYLDGYILAAGGGGRFYWSDVTSSLSWSGLSFATAIGAPDDTVAMHILNREIYLFGERSIEIWEDDGETPFSRVQGGFIESGCAAAYGVVLDQGIFYWIDQDRQFVRFAGKSVERMSSRFNAEFQSLSTVSDCRAHKINIGANVFFVFSFPTANRCFVYNLASDDWSEWGRWDSERMVYDKWIAGAYCYAQDWGRHLIGRSDKKVIAELSHSYASDDGDLIRCARKTGPVDFGSLKKKRGGYFSIRARRGDGLSGSNASLLIRVRDDGGVWSNPRDFDLGELGEYDITLRARLGGMFRSREYEVVASDAVPLSLLGAEHDIEVLR